MLRPGLRPELVQAIRQNPRGMSRAGLAWDPSSIPGLISAKVADDVPQTTIPIWPDNVDVSLRGIAQNTTDTPVGIVSGVAGRRSAVYSGSLEQHVLGTASDWPILHNGAGVTVVAYLRSTSLLNTQAVFDTTNGYVGIGASLVYLGTSQYFGFRVRHESGYANATNEAGGTSPPNVDRVVVCTIAAGANGVGLWNNGVRTITSTLTTPSAADPATALALGSSSNLTSGSFGGYIRAFLVYNRVLTPDEIAVVTAGLPRYRGRRTQHIVWPIGDSITENSASYRKTLWVRSCSTLTQRLHYVGSDTVEGQWPQPVSEYSHDGHSGYTIQAMQAEVATWAASVTTAPTRIIVMAGTNNYAGDTPSAALARLPGLLGAIGSIYPMAQIYLCSIPPSNGTIPARDAWIIEFNAGVPAVATAAGAAHVDINAGPYALTQADITGDAVHPTADGHAKIGNTIADSMGF